MDLETPGAGLAIVTGAAGGMGSAIAGRLGKDGFELLLCDLDSAALEAVAAGVGTGRKVEILAADVSSRGFGAQLLNAVAGRRIGALVHCAGLSPSMADALRILQVNYDGAVQTMEAVRSRMATGGCVVLIASISAYWPKPAALSAAIANLAQGEGSDALRPFAPTPQEAYHVSKDRRRRDRRPRLLTSRRRLSEVGRKHNSRRNTIGQERHQDAYASHG